MTGYYPLCPNCHRCMKCNGEGTVTNVKYEKNWKGEQVRVERRDTCPSCRGVVGASALVRTTTDSRPTSVRVADAGLGRAHRALVV